MSKRHLITREGWQSLKDEFEYLWRTKRPEVTRAVTEAAAHGDRSENAEYKEAKRELRGIDRRLRYLTKRLEILEVVDYTPEQDGRVFFGAYVELENEDEEIMVCRLVGSDEIDPEKKHITLDSPMAKAVLGKEVDDEVVVHTPNGKVYWSINRIWYVPSQA